MCMESKNPWIHDCQSVSSGVSLWTSKMAPRGAKMTPQAAKMTSPSAKMLAPGIPKCSVADLKSAPMRYPRQFCKSPQSAKPPMNWTLERPAAGAKPKDPPRQAEGLDAKRLRPGRRPSCQSMPEVLIPLPPQHPVPPAPVCGKKPRKDTGKKHCENGA